jgi:hypothetical protein
LAGQRPRNLNLASKKHLKPLLLGELLAIAEELFHAVVIAILQKVFKAVAATKFLVGIGQQADVDYRKQILYALHIGAGATKDNDELLLSLGTQLQGDTLG